MQTYISILRGINVSGHKSIKMEALRKLYQQLNFKQVQTYIQSGNVIFQAHLSNQEDLQLLIQQKIKETFDFDVPVLIKEKSYFDEIIRLNPFINKNMNSSKWHVTFLSQMPSTPLLEKLKSHDFLPDEFVIVDDAIYLHCPNGYGISKLNNTFFEKKLEVSATTRNWKTINELVNMANKLNQK